MMSSSPLGDRISALLNDVPLPDGLLGRLRMIPLATDADFDRALADVALPADLADRLSAIPSAPGRWSPTLSSAMSATVKRVAAAVAMFAVGLGYIFSVTALVYSRFDQPLLAAEPLRAAWSQLSGATAGEETWVTLEATALESPPATDAECRIPAIDRPESGRVELARSIGFVDEPLALAEFSDPIAMSRMTASIEVVAERLGEWPIERSCVQVVGGVNADVGSGPPGRALPWFDAAKNGTIAVELSADDASYRCCRREIGSGRLPLDACIRVEEFLAAFEYDLVDQGVAEPAAGTPAITIAAGPSPYDPLADALLPETDRHRWLVAVGIGSSELADSPRVTLDLAPQRVKAYRIVGYGLAPASEDDGREARVRRAGGAQSFLRTSTVLLFEIELNEVNASLAPLGEIQLAWRDSQGRPHEAAAPLSWRSFAERFETAPVGWRQAAIVALVAESLAGSPFAEHVSLADLVLRARQIEPLVDDRAGWREFIELIGKAQSLRVISQSIRGLPGA
jgi:hypothetical protein